MIRILLPIIVVIIIAIILIIVVWFIKTMNNLRQAEVKVDEALSDIDVALMKRYDVLTKMLDITKGYANYEKETLLETMKLRSNMSMAERNNAIEEMDEAFQFVNAVSENYPQLNAIENYRALQSSVMNVEEHLQAARRLCNGNIAYLNQRIVSFPASMVAGMLNIARREFLKIDSEQRKDIKMSF